MMSAPGALLHEAVGLGLKLQPEGNNLRITPARLCSANFMDALRQQKKELLHLLRLPFVMVYSERLGETLFFCEDEAAKARLVEAEDDVPAYCKVEGYITPNIGIELRLPVSRC